MTIINLIVSDRHGRRAVVMIENAKFVPFDSGADMADYRLFDVRRVEVYGDNYTYEWLNQGEYTGVKP